MVLLQMEWKVERLVATSRTSTIALPIDAWVHFGSELTFPVSRFFLGDGISSLFSYFSLYSVVRGILPGTSTKTEERIVGYTRIAGPP